MRFFHSIFLFLLGIVPFTGYAQTDSTSLDFIPNYIELGGLATADRTPFWLQTNQFGVIPRSGSALLMRGGMQHAWRLSQPDSLKQWRKGKGSFSPEQGWHLEVGAEVAANVGSSEQRVLLPQAYGALRYGNWELWVGRKKQWVGLGDSTLGTGSYAWSGNSLPIPKVQIGLTRFTNVPFTKGWLSVLGFYSEGWFENSRPVTSELRLHQKQLYGRFGKPSGKFRLYGGINHQVQWGGKSPYETVSNQMPKSFKDYILVVLARPSRGTLDTTATFFDNSNRVGNHLGTLDMGFEFLGTHATWLIYRQNFYEDGSLFKLKNLKDGLNGLKIKLKSNTETNFEVQEVLVEVLYTKNQGGSAFLFNQAIFGKDNYFNHTQVRDGWSYYDRTIGTPFIPPTSETIWKFPNYGDAFTSNNRVWALHAGLQGRFFTRFEWSTKLSYSSNAGVYDLPFPTTVYQFSGLLTLQTRTNWLGGTLIKGSLATDSGGLYPNSFGGILSLRKEGLFRLKN